jgi:hypothetical protein
MKQRWLWMPWTLLVLAALPVPGPLLVLSRCSMPAILFLFAVRALASEEPWLYCPVPRNVLL